MKRFIVYALLLCCCSNILFAQPLSTKNKKAIAAYNEALQNYQLQYFDKAKPLLLEAIKIDTKFAEAYFLLAGVHSANNNIPELLATLKNATIECGEYQPIAYYKYAYELYDNGLYVEAAEQCKIAAEYIQMFSPFDKERLYKLNQSCALAISFIEKPIPFNPINLGTAINSTYDEYQPAITIDDETLLYTVLLPVSQGDFQEDIFVSNKKNNIWEKSFNIGAPLNSPRNEGAVSISGNGKTMVFTMCNAPAGFGSCDLYISNFSNGEWSKPKNIGAPVNTNSWESQPSLSADGRTLYFASNRKNGYGKKDIWVSKLQDNNTWSTPENLGTEINTSESDETPFIHADGVTLFFSSLGHAGLGKQDIFISQLKNKTWSTPINAGYPINTAQDETFFIINAAVTKGYFSSDRSGGNGGKDLYEFAIPKELPLKPNPVTYVTGVVFNAKNKAEKLSADVEIADITTGEVYYKYVADHGSGKFILPFTKNKTFALLVKHKGFLFYSEQINIERIKGNLLIGLQPIEVGNTVVLNNVYFDTDKFDLKPESITELKTIVRFMKDNPTVCFEIGGHTDNTGDKQKNITLSNNRAKSVYTYLTTEGIEASRLSFKGYAETMPVLPNTTPENKAKNRRTELKITKITLK